MALMDKQTGPLIELTPPYGNPSLEAGSKHVRHIRYMTLLSAILTIPIFAPLSERELAYSSASLALAIIVQFIIAGPFYLKALKALIFPRVIKMDLLIVLSTSAAYIFSIVSFRAIKSISIQSLQALTAILINKESGAEREIDARLLLYSDTFKVLPDTRILTDSTVITGSSEVDESILIGKSRPAEKYPKSVVITGSINRPRVITIRLNRLPSDNTIHAIAAIVNKAKLLKPKLYNLADRVVSYFIPMVVALTIITYRGSKATIQAITYAITVLIVSCLYAMGLAVLMVIMIASGVAAEWDIIFKSTDAIKVTYKTLHIVFNKMGTLARGKLSVIRNKCVNKDKLPLLLGLVKNSRYPVSVAIAAYLKDISIMTSTVPKLKSLTSKGIKATLGG
ncbi:P-type cation-transporting ATPase [Fusarium culmorum]|uniref:P-type cation-transporting ATPase n=1 Tax=Fusarium culmorum TaxID=5516 RepID=A0A2T4GRU5_FUSCU|nr:P-type cation-transporting ATPase [Fusarium culmorum]